MTDFTIIGYVVINMILGTQGERVLLGGAPTYGALVAKKLGKSVKMVTKIGGDIESARAQVSWSGTQTLTWEPELGDYWIVGMNADGSMGVDIEIQMGVRLPILRTIGGIILAVGLILLLIGLSLFRGVI